MAMSGFLAGTGGLAARTSGFLVGTSGLAARTSGFRAGSCCRSKNRSYE
ncbi:hypothetical protein PGH26_00610 [Sporosarcina jeotgali]|uniref:Uncharacterized protein n=1 Tax=Sporosarcina jeotgali TaxID=3020056 RepID=A0ABZ0KVM1_9BACL|nr:hypothetical protein [Sporosarcina sp. B2O-1]WOV84457.1 hypothetical protein PGH26_00610 [Sporosarcina sp. B2O-1]